MKRFLLVTVSAIASFIAVAQQASARTFEGTYRVPVEPGLQAYAEFPIRFHSNGGTPGNPERLRYKLPKELVGRDVEVELSSLGGGSYGGDKGEAACTTVDSATRCRITYKNVGIDLNEVRTHLLRTFSDPWEIARRFEVAEAFSTEPIGIVEFSTALVTPRSRFNY